MAWSTSTWNGWWNSGRQKTEDKTMCKSTSESPSHSAKSMAIQWKDRAQLPNPHGPDLSSTQGNSSHFTIQGTPVASTIDVQCQIEGQQVPSELLTSCKEVQGNSLAKLGPSGLRFPKLPNQIGKVHFPKGTQNFRSQKQQKKLGFLRWNHLAVIFFSPGCHATPGALPLRAAHGTREAGDVDASDASAPVAEGSKKGQAAGPPPEGSAILE